MPISPPPPSSRLHGVISNLPAGRSLSGPVACACDARTKRWGPPAAGVAVDPCEVVPARGVDAMPADMVVVDDSQRARLRCLHDGQWSAKAGAPPRTFVAWYKGAVRATTPTKAVSDHNCASNMQRVYTAARDATCPAGSET